MGKIPSRAEAWRTLATMAGHWTLKGFGLFAIEEKAGGDFVGRVGPFMPEGWPGLELGWGLAQRHFGKGYAIEAARAAGTWVFETQSAAELISLIHVENVASQAVAMRLNMIPRTPTLLHGAPHTLWAIRRADWQ